MVQMVQLRVVARHGDLAAVLRPHPDIHRADGEHFGMLAVDQAAGRIVAGPACMVACFEDHRRGLVEVEPVADVAGRVDPPLPAVGMRQQHTPVLRLQHAAGIAGLGFDAVDVVMEDGDVARPVVRNVALLRARQVQVDVALDLQLGTA